MAVMEVTKENFEQIVTENNFIIIDYWAPWCGPCQSFGPVFEKVSEDYPDTLFCKVNTEEEQEIAGHFQIRSIPTLMILREQVMLYNEAGALPEGALRDILDRAKSLDMEEVRKEIAKEQAANQ
jgi:thioredoxin 1